MQSRLTEREPIYDGIGPRTSADGSSRLCLSKSLANPGVASATPSSSSSGLPSGPLPGMVLPPQTTPTATQTLHRLLRPAPIAELQECPPTPDKKKGGGNAKSTPNILDSANPPVNVGDSLLASSSEATLIEENLSGYCEPFGKARKPDDDGGDDGNSAGNRNSVASSSSSSGGVVVVSSETRDPKSARSNSNNKMSVASLSAPKSSTPLKENGVGGPANGHKNGDDGDGGGGGAGKPKPPAPKTLPKPKVKPVPPPKPKKSFSEAADSSHAPLISFQDEGVDGSEV